MSATTEQAIARLDAAEYGLVDVLAGLPAAANGAGGRREQALEVLEKLRATKRALLARSPDVLHKASRLAGHPEVRRASAEPHWRGLPVDGIAAKTLEAEARSRRAEEQRLAKKSGQADPGQAAIATLKAALARPIVGDRRLVAFLNRHAGR